MPAMLIMHMRRRRCGLCLGGGVSSRVAVRVIVMRMAMM